MVALEAASLLCKTVYECNAPLLRRLLTAGAPVDAGDYVSALGFHPGLPMFWLFCVFFNLVVFLAA